MTKIDNFKDFVKRNPNLVTYVKKGQNTWQNFYELYDLYGEDNSIWNKYLNKEEERSTKGSSTISNILEMAKNLDADKLQDGITSLQKAIDLFGGILIKDKTNNTESNYTPRPVYRRFDD